MRVAVQVSRRDQSFHLARPGVEDDHLLLPLVEAGAAWRAAGQLLHGEPDVYDHVVVLDIGLVERVVTAILVLDLARPLV